MRAGLPLALTMGEPAGIGPELSLRVWERRTPATRPFYVLADPAHLARLAATLSIACPVREATPETAAAVFADALPVVALSGGVTSAPGRPAPDDARLTIEAITTGVEHVRLGRAAAIVTNPIAKDVLYATGFAHPGHTEFLAALAARFWNAPEPHPVMMLWSSELAVVPVTVHIPLAAVPARLTTALIVETARIVAADLTEKFGIALPRLALAGLNPHAGENGTMGLEDREVIAPAVAILREAGLAVAGPSPADTLFHAAARARYDAVLAMYHDQALIPIKTLAFDTAVNVTLGLPFVRTSPDHGTAFDIAGQGIARPDSLLAALALAARLVA